MLEKSTPSQKGEMSRLAIEVKSGVFVATIGARVRDKLWDKISGEWNVNAIMIYSTNNEQGYGIRSNGDPDREVIDFEGIHLLARPVKKTRTKKEESSD
jgi:CRISPR-associated protein Cas2